MYDLIIFDCDGVLIDSEWLANQVEVEELGRLGYSIPLEEYLDIALGRTNDEVTERLLALYDFRLPDDHWKKVRQWLEKEFVAGLVAIPGAKEVVANLTVPSCVASSSDSARLRLTLGITGFLPHLEGRIFGRECVAKGKPEPDIFLHAASQMDVPPSRCLVIEDSIHGIHAARAAEMEVWAFCGGRHYSPQRKQLLADSGASLIFDDMEGLREQIKAGTYLLK